MGFRNTENEYSQYTTSQIYWQLENHGLHLSANELFVLCDQLLQRRQPIRHLSQRFEDIVHSLKRDAMKYIEKYDDRFSAASVHLVVRYLKRVGSSISSWYFLRKDQQYGPFDRFQIENELQTEGIDHVWKEGWGEWKTPRQLDFVTNDLYYDQIFPSYVDEFPRENQINEFETSEEGSALAIVTGILALLGMPIWLVSCFALPIVSHDTFTGWFLPLIASIFMLIATIPMGIGVMMRRLWAWNITVFSSILMLVWFGVLIVHNDVSSFWYGMSFYQGLLLILALGARGAFNRHLYEKSTA